jgi:hypothetical protein
MDGDSWSQEMEEDNYDSSDIGRHFLLFLFLILFCFVFRKTFSSLNGSLGSKTGQNGQGGRWQAPSFLKVI